MKLSLRAVALTAGLMWAACVLLVGLVHLADPRYGGEFIDVMSSLYPGLHFMHRWQNVVAATIYGFIDGAISGLIFAWIYDRLVGAGHATNHPA